MGNREFYLSLGEKIVDVSQRLELKQKIGEINRRILDCERIWERYAPWDS